VNFKERVEDLNKQIEAIKREFEVYIADKSIPLDERWEVFMNAPADLRQHYCFLKYFKGVPDDFVSYDGYVPAARHETVSVDRILESLEEMVDDVAEIDIVAFKEDVLSKNLYSFEYDW
jgi:hypothetical protein